MSKIKNDGLTWVWHRMLYKCTHMETVGVKGLTVVFINFIICVLRCIDIIVYYLL